MAKFFFFHVKSKAYNPNLSTPRSKDFFFFFNCSTVRWYVFYYCITSYCKLWLKTTCIYYLKFCRSEVWAQLGLVLCLGSHYAVMKVVGGLCSCLKAQLGKNHLEVHSGCWQNSFPRGFSFLLAAGCWQRPSLSPQSCHYFCHAVLSMGSSQQGRLLLQDSTHVRAKCNRLSCVTIWSWAGSAFHLTYNEA